MDLKIFHDTVRYFVNVEQGGWLSPEEIDNITDRAQMWLFTSSIPSYGKTSKATDPLSPFSVNQSFTTAGDGIITLPTNAAVSPCYEALPVVTVSYYDGTKMRYKGTKLFNEDEIAERLDSQVLEPTVTDPIAQETVRGTIQLYPKTVLTGFCTYLRRPKPPVFVYTMDDKTIVYDQGASTQLEWTESNINKILVKALNMFGVNLSDEMLIQYTEMKNQQDI